MNRQKQVQRRKQQVKSSKKRNSNQYNVGTTIVEEPPKKIIEWWKKEGFVEKLSGYVWKSWDYRFFKMSKTHLHYFKNRGDDVPKRSIPLRACKTSLEHPVLYKYQVNRPFTFVLYDRTVDPPHPYFIDAQAESKRKEWIEVFEYASRFERADLHGHHEYLWKFVVIGDPAVGKSSLIRRVTHNMYSPRYKQTKNVTFSFMRMNWSPTVRVTIQTWDIGGEEKNGRKTGVYYQGCVAGIVVVDPTQKESLVNGIAWARDLRKKTNHEIPIVIVGSKADRIKPKDVDKVKKFLRDTCNENEFIGSWLTSAKEDHNALVPWKALVAYLVDNMDTLPFVKSTEISEAPIIDEDD